jgi:ribosomal protein L7Ae-like RNA K-turn-binding protein
MSLVRRAALDKDADAVAELVKVLQPADLALLRLMALKTEKRVQKLERENAASSPDGPASALLSSRGKGAGVGLGGKGKSGASAPAPAVPSKPVPVSLTGGGMRFALGGASSGPMGAGGGRGGAGGASSSSSSAPAKGEGLLGLEKAVDAGMKHHAQLEKERKERERKAKVAGFSSLTASGVEKSAGSGAGASAGSEPDKPLSRLLRQLHRQKIVRAWVYTSLRAKLRDNGMAAANTTSAHAALLKGKGGGGKGKGAKGEGVKGKGEGKGKGGGKAAGGATPASNAGQASGGAAPSSAPPAPLLRKRGTRRLTRLKKVLLRERIDRWLDAHPEAAPIYRRLRTEHEEAQSAEAKAANEARKALRDAAVRILRDREAAVILRKINRGKIILPSVRAPVPGLGGRMKLTTVDPKAYAKGLAERMVLSRRRIQKTALILVAKGKMKAPDVAAREAKEAAVRAAADGVAAADETQMDGADDAAVRAAVETAARLARMDITRSTRSTIITSAIPKNPGGPTKGEGAEAAGAGAGPGAEGQGPKKVTVNPRGVAVRNYVDQDLSPALDTICAEMLSTAYFYQERARAEDQRKAMRRLVVGLREVARGCRTGRVRLVIVAPNIDQSDAEGGLDEQVHGIIDAARAANVPVIFALSRKRLGAALGSTFRMSVVGFYTFESLRGLQNQALALAEELRTKWRVRNARIAAGGAADAADASAGPAAAGDGGGGGGAAEPPSVQGGKGSGKGKAAKAKANDTVVFAAESTDGGAEAASHPRALLRPSAPEWTPSWASSADPVPAPDDAISTALQSSLDLLAPGGLGAVWPAGQLLPVMPVVPVPVPVPIVGQVPLPFSVPAPVPVPVVALDAYPALLSAALAAALQGGDGVPRGGDDAQGELTEEDAGERSA